MRVIRRPRNSGKTTMLLHYMELAPHAILIVGKEDTAKRVHEFAQSLGLDIGQERIVGVSVARKIDPANHIILVDDLDWIIKKWPKLGYEVAGIADIITIVK